MNPNREPPHSLEAERSTLGGVLVKPSVFEEIVATLTTGDFLLPAHREIFEAMLQLRERRLPIDVLALTEELKNRGMLGRLEGKQAYLIDLAASVPTAENITHYARIVLEKSTRRKLIDTCAEVQGRAYGDAETDDLLADAREQIAKIELAGAAGKSHTVALAAAAQEVWEEMQRIEQGEAPLRISSGIPELDKYIGGFEGGDVVVLAGRPGTGKSALAAQVCYCNGKLGIPGLYFSLEMKNRKLVRRLISSEAQVSGRALRGLVQLDKAAWSKVMGAIGAFGKTSMSLNDTSRRLQDILAESRLWHTRAVRSRKLLDGRIDKRALLVVDYAQLVESVRKKGGNREQEVSDISRSLKQLSMDLDLPLLLLASLNRECEKDKRPPRPSDLRESGSLESDASIILFTHKDGDQHQILIGKNRDDRTGFVRVTFDGDLMTFYAAAEESEEPPQDQTHWTQRRDE
jgi:replicative DNA helicase